MNRLSDGDLLPHIAVPPPGPQSRALAGRLRNHESPNITFVSDDGPIFWREARGSNVLDVDGNVYIDLTAGFGVAAGGHRNPRVIAAAQAQLELLAHGLGDVHPPEIKTATLERLASVTPPGLERSILASSGAEAVEAALKTARLASGRPGVLCFSGAYHGLTYGALAVTDGRLFREHFEDQLGLPTARVPFPNPFRPPAQLRGHDNLASAALEVVSARLESNQHQIGAVIVEPIQGRGGTVIPPEGFLSGLRDLCDRFAVTLIFDEIYTGFGRTGRWFACDHEAVVPDLLCVGKALTGAFPFSACIGRPEVMAAWPESAGAAIHTSTFLGHPPACAAALAQIEEIESRQLVDRAARLGERLQQELQRLRSRLPAVGDARGRGLLAAIELVRSDTGAPDPAAAARIVQSALREGLILLVDGPEANVIGLAPPLTIAESQLDFALSTLQGCLARP